MATEPKPTPDFFQSFEGIKLRTRRFGSKPLSPFVPVPVGEIRGESPVQREFKVCWEDQKQGLKVIVRARDDGRLIADVFATDIALLNKAWVSVSLVGNAEHDTQRKSIPLNAPEENGCSGSADFGPLVDVVTKLGPELGLVVFLLM